MPIDPQHSAYQGGFRPVEAELKTSRDPMGLFLLGITLVSIANFGLLLIIANALGVF